MTGWKRKILNVCILLIFIFAISINSFAEYFIQLGRTHLMRSAQNTLVPNAMADNGYCSDLINILFLGIDSNDEVSPAVDGISGGQSDALFIVTIDTEQDIVKVTAIHRNTMTWIDVYDRNGDYLGRGIGQITLQHGYGDGMEVSCGRTEKVVSELFYGLPIHGYCSINMGVIEAVNDVVGGVEIVSLEDINIPEMQLKKGEKVILNGEQAHLYLEVRDTSSFDSASSRQEREVQYLKAFADQTLEKCQTDTLLPVKLYMTLKDYMVTDLDSFEILYLVKEVMNCDMETLEIYNVPGEAVMGEKFEEFYIDEVGFMDMYRDIFCE